MGKPSSGCNTQRSPHDADSMTDGLGHARGRGLLVMCRVGGRLIVSHSARRADAFERGMTLAIIRLWKRDSGRLPWEGEHVGYSIAHVLDLWERSPQELKDEFGSPWAMLWECAPQELKDEFDKFGSTLAMRAPRTLAHLTVSSDAFLKDERDAIRVVTWNPVAFSHLPARFRWNKNVISAALTYCFNPGELPRSEAITDQEIQGKRSEAWKRWDISSYLFKVWRNVNPIMQSSKDGYHRTIYVVRKILDRILRKTPEDEVARVRSWREYPSQFPIKGGTPFECLPFQCLYSIIRKMDILDLPNWGEFQPPSQAQCIRMFYGPTTISPAL